MDRTRTLLSFFVPARAHEGESAEEQRQADHRRGALTRGLIGIRNGEVERLAVARGREGGGARPEHPGQHVAWFHEALLLDRLMIRSDSARTAAPAPRTSPRRPLAAT